MIEIFSYPFMQKALVAGVILGFLLAVLGVFVNLRRMAFFADGIAHASLSGVAIGLLFSFSPFLMAIILTVIFAVILFFLEEKKKISSDTAIGIVFTAGMSLGVILMSFKAGYQPDLISFLFGNILAISTFDLWIIVILSFVALVFVFSFIKSLTLLALDDESAYILGVKVFWLKLCFYVVLAVSVVLGIKALGVLLVSGLLIIPVAIAKNLARSFRKMIFWSVIFSELIVFLGLSLSYFWNLPTGPLIVLIGTVILILSFLLAKKR